MYKGGHTPVNRFFIPKCGDCNGPIRMGVRGDVRNDDIETIPVFRSKLLCQMWIDEMGPDESGMIPVTTEIEIKEVP